MSAKEFWEEDRDLFWAYRFSFYNKQKKQTELDNCNAWLQGMYIYEAVSVALCNAFSDSKLEYSKEPYKPAEEKKEETRQEEQNIALIELKGRISQIQAMFKNKEENK